MLLTTLSSSLSLNRSTITRQQPTIVHQQQEPTNRPFNLQQQPAHQDTLAALHQAPLDLPTLFPDTVLKKAEEDISKSEEKGLSHSRWRFQSRFHPYKRSDERIQEQKSENQLKKHWDSSGKRKVIISPTSFHHVRPKVSHCINDNYCVSAPVSRLLTQRKETVKLVNLCQLHRTGQPKQQRDCKLVCQSVTNVVNSVLSL